MPPEVVSRGDFDDLATMVDDLSRRLDRLIKMLETDGILTVAVTDSLHCRQTKVEEFLTFKFGEGWEQAAELAGEPLPPPTNPGQGIFGRRPWRLPDP